MEPISHKVGLVPDGPVEPIAGGTHFPSSGIGAGGVRGETEKRSGKTNRLQRTDCGRRICEGRIAEDRLRRTDFGGRIAVDESVRRTAVTSGRVCSGVGTQGEQRHGGVLWQSVQGHEAVRWCVVALVHGKCSKTEVCNGTAVYDGVDTKGV